MLRNLFASAVIFYGSVAPSYAAMDATSGTFFFRYKAGYTQGAENPENESKDITASYIGGINESFSEKLPMKAQWQNDNWVVTGGRLPDGVSFNPATLTFSGVPTKAQSVVAELTGYGSNGDPIASASASFDIVLMPDYSRKVDLYGHTGTFFFKQFDVPAGMTVDRWQMIYALPEGLTTIGRNIDGTPTKAGNYRYLLLGYPYQAGAEAIVAYSGNFIVEEKSEFPEIADKLYAFDPAVDPHALLFSNMPVTPINNVLGKASDVRYFVDVQNNENLPGNLKVSNNAFDRTISGQITTHYDQATIRYRAKDIDDRESISNWFKIGSLGPTPKCGVYKGELPPSTIVGRAGTPLQPYGIPTVNSSGAQTYVMTSGTLPEGISFNRSTGVFSGTPVKEEITSGINVQVNVANGSNVDSVTCGPYDFDIKPATFGLGYTLADKDIRVGETLDGTLKPGGGLLGNWSVALDDPASLPSTVNFAGGQSLTVKGPVNVKGSFAPAFTLTNGDGRTANTTMTFSVHDALTIDDVPNTLSIKKYASVDKLLQATYDQEAIIGSAKLTLIGGSLPSAATPQQSLSLNSFTGLIAGGTDFDPGTYGPYKIRLTDDHGGSDETNSFNIEVLPRDNMVGTTTAPTFTVNYDEANGQQPLTVVQPKLAETLAKNWSINQTPPDGLTFHTDTGRITGMPAQVGTYPGYQISVADTDGGSAQSDIFTITVQEPPQPQGIRQADIQGNVNGRAIVTKTPTFVEESLIDGVSAVKYVDATPTVPGLTFDPKTGILSGQATAEYHGDVHINFVDGAGRPGSAPVQIDVYPYPTVSMEKDVYDLPRLSQATAADVTAKPNTGFFGGAAYKLAPTSAALPTGLTLSSVSGQVTGQLTAAIGEYKNIIIRATDNVTGIFADTAPFSIKAGTAAPLTLTSNAPLVTYELKDQTWEYVSDTGITFSPVGSYKAPLSYSLMNAPTGVTINPQNGRLTGSPTRLGSWTATIAAVDAEGTPATPYDFNIKATLTGYVASSSVQAPSDVPNGGHATVRVGETFQTAAQLASNYVGSLTYSGVNNPATLPLIDSSLGIFRGSINAAGDFVWGLSVKDSDGRGYYKGAGPTFGATVIDPLELSLSQTSFAAGTQYSANNPINIQFPKAVDNQIGNLLYGVVGTLPGNLYYLNYANNDLSGTKSWSHQNGDGSWSTLSSAGSLPDDALVFDTLLATLNGIPSGAGNFSDLYLVVSDDHDLTYIANDPTRIDYNSASAGPFTISVDAQPLKIVSSANPKQVIVPDGNASVTLSPVNHAYGKAVTWTPGSGNLPSGITYKVNGNNVDFSGYWTTKGTYSIPFTVKDALGRTATATQEFKVVLSTDPIDLNVYNITSKVGMPVKMEPPFASAVLSTGNSFGTLTFASTDLAGHPAVNLDKATGVISGSLGSTQSFTFNMSVTDETNRITSKPVTVNVIPNLRLVYPTQLSAIQGTDATTAVDTAYNIGAVSYELAAGQTLPAGMTLDTTTGAIKGAPTAVAGTYPDYVIYGTDKAGDRQPSNAFSIIVKPIQAYPKIASVVNSKLIGTVGTAFGYTPTVTRSDNAKPWTYPATFSINHDISSYGLTFDPATGVISGTPTAPFYFTDMVIAASNDYGSSQTAAFAFGMQPAGPITLAANQITTHTYRVGDVIADAPPLFDNTYGKLTYATNINRPSATTLNTSTGVLSGTLDSPMTIAMPLTVTDAFGRTLTAPITYSVKAKLTVSVTSPTTTITQGTAYGAMNTPTVGNAVGTKTFEVIGLPTGLTYSTSTGAIQGTVPLTTYTSGTAFPVEVWVTDSFDQTKGKATYTLMVVDTFQAKAGQTAATTIRGSEIYTFPTPIFENGVGTLTYSGSYYTAYSMGNTDPNGSINASTGVVTVNPSIGTASTNGYVTIFAKDSLNRTATLTFNFTVIPALAVTGVTQSFTDKNSVARTKPVTVKNSLGTLTYAYSGLPTGLQVDSATGEIYGTLDTGITSGSQAYPVTATVTDSFNNKTVTGTFSIVVQAAGNYSLFNASQVPERLANDGSQLSVGVQFKANIAGNVLAIRFYRSANDTGQNVVDLWSSTGTKLATATRSGTTGSGWQTVTFATPVAIAANTTYVASYHSTGAYVATNSFFGGAVSNGPLTALAGGGVYTYGGSATAGVFPSGKSGQNPNYWADVVFEPTP